MADICEHSNGHSSYINDREFLNYLSNFSLSRLTRLRGQMWVGFSEHVPTDNFMEGKGNDNSVVMSMCADCFYRPRMGPHVP